MRDDLHRFPPHLQRELKRGGAGFDWREAVLAGVLAICGTVAAAVLFAAAFIVMLSLFSSNAWAQDVSQHPNRRGWIDRSCCCTNSACREMQPGELVRIDADTYRVVATARSQAAPAGARTAPSCAVPCNTSLARAG